MKCDLLWEEAYERIARNQGSLTPGVDGETFDGFSPEKLHRLTSQVFSGTYRPSPVRRVYPLAITARDAPAIWQRQIVAERWQDYGWFIWVLSPGRDAMPPSLQACLAAAEAAGADWIQFDRDCAPIDELPVHDW